jgi:Spy/CpxP family protein refolding chaperone
MRTLATIMISISLVTVALFAHALATADDRPPVVRVEQTAAR